MFLYISENRLNELRQRYQKISVLFPMKEQNVMQQFFCEVETLGGCVLETYNNIYSILNQVYNRLSMEDRKSKRKKQKCDAGSNEESSKENGLLEILNILRLQFATKYYFTAQKGPNSNDILNNNNIN